MTEENKGENGRCMKSAPNSGSVDYAYESIEEFESIVGYKVNDTFRMAWSMARTTNKMLGIK